MILTGLKWLSAAVKKHNMLCFAELMRGHDTEHYSQYVDIIQIGGRNMSNFFLLSLHFR